jgi:lysophospholipase L1-like esterase/dienelactone hydrolase
MARTLALFVLVGWAGFAVAQPAAPAGLPKVLLIGDSIRLGYAPLVAKKLAGTAEVISVPAPIGDTTVVLKHLDEWLAGKPAVVHFNSGLHDVKVDKAAKTHQVPVETYKRNLTTIVERVRKVTPLVVFANTTPIRDDRHAGRKAAFDRFEKDVSAYNAAATATMAGLGVAVNDLHRIVEDGGSETLLGRDGTHFTPAGNERLAEAVADCVRRQLAVAFPRRLTPPAAGPAAVAAYKKAEAELDALVPEPYRSFRSPAFAVPADAAAWAGRRPAVLDKVVASLGDFPPRPAKPTARLVSAERRAGFRLERLRLDTGLGDTFSAMLLVPDGLTRPAPAVFWLHSSSFDHTQLLVPNTNGGEEPLGVTLTKKGYVVFAPDAAWYGERARKGPGGEKEDTTAQQTSLHKFDLWLGRTLWGRFVRDDRVALDYLCSRPEVDGKKIGATGISMGSTRSWWLAAVDDRVAAVASVACLTRYENLIRHGQLKQHGVYYFADGLLKHFDTEAVVSLVAPRPCLFLTGELDAGSPADGIAVIEEKAGGVYRAVGAAAAFRSVRYPEVGHTYTPAMRAEMLAWFDKHLK